MSRASLCLLAASALQTFTCVSQENPVFRTGISLVRVDAEVTDGARTLTNFSRDDFRIWDNGTPQDILHFSQDEEPLDLILLFDISGSMHDKVKKVAATARTAMSELRAGDRIAVMTFHSRSRIVASFSDDFDEVERTINRDVVGGKFRGGTRLLAGVDDAAKYFLDQPRTRRRRAVLILTDNYGQRSRRGSTVTHHLWEADALLSGLIIRSGGQTAVHNVMLATHPYAALLAEGMTGVAEKTGGDTVKSDDPGPAFREMMLRIRQRYSLYYAMPQGKPGEVRQVRVELGDTAKSKYPTGRVRARKGYLMPANTAG